MYDIVCIGGITYDTFFRSQYVRSDSHLFLPWGEKKVVEEMFVSLGGGGANAAVGFSRLGLKVGLFSKIGTGHISRSVLDRLNNECVDTSLILKDSLSHTSSSTILLDVSGERSIVMYRGNNDIFDFSQASADKLLDTKWLYIADLASSDDKNGFVLSVVTEASRHGVKIAFTPSQRQISQGLENLKSIINQLDVLVLNQYEWNILTHSMPKEDANSLGAKLTVITKDKEGVHACEGNGECFTHPAPSVPAIIDTTGAGDSFASGLVSALFYGKTVPEALIWGTKNAGSVISQIGAQKGLLTLNEL